MFQITPLPAFNDNYIWVICSPDNSNVAVVDPGDAEVVKTYLKQNNLTLAAILITHHHNDHTGGVFELNSAESIPVYGPANSPFKGITHPLADNDSISLFGQELQIRAVPAHTLDHISYYTDKQLFCGDTLFLAGCGRLFEGTPAQMLAAMDYFKTLPDETEVFCTHEYSMANLQFAAAVEPENSAIKNVTAACAILRNENKPTLPSSIAQEKQINPFMRTSEASVNKAGVAFSKQVLNTETEVMTAIREWKNQF